MCTVNRDNVSSPEEQPTLRNLSSLNVISTNSTPDTRYAVYTCHFCGIKMYDYQSYRLDDVITCKKCWYAQQSQCYFCSRLVPSNDSRFSYGRLLCYDCNTPILPYNTKPSIPTFHGEAKNGLYYGVELEFEIQKYTDNEYVASGMYSNHFYVKHDGSLEYGIEIVSDPCSWKVITDQNTTKHIFNSVALSALATCGMHVHMSKGAFTSLHLYKFMKFIYEEPSFTLFVSDRSRTLIRRWAGLNRAGDTSIKYKALTKHGGPERHVAVALTQHTVEVRIFKGVQTYSRFMKNMEFCEALFNFSRDNSVSDINRLNFVKYVMASKQYPHLVNLIKTKTYNELPKYIKL